MPVQQPPVPSSQLPTHLILASGSPRRRELLEEARYDFTVVPPLHDVECGVCSESGPAGLVAELAYRKALAVRQQLASSAAVTSDGITQRVIVAADTVAECDGFILGKPSDESMARAMLAQLSGREHRVLTGICLLPLPLGEGRGEAAVSVQSHSTIIPTPSHKVRGEPLIRVAVTKLRMDQLTDAQLNEYLESGQWEGKAGSFGYQDRLGWVHIVEGSESNVVGLPLELLAEMLAEVATRQ